ncbi:hypothetical protein [Actinophytocola glycyrrhizae]|uniref:Uncharacterized protein n=1 Tax=Actinophytocola glycyrrhizae TaxID=2044873 RepID=A0ABV9S037_9PSEU
MVTLAGQRPDDDGAAPQRPLLYEPDDNDAAARGACVDLAMGGDDDCEPYQEVAVPGDPDEILAATNRHVQCAVFTDAVEAVFGTTYRPVTWAAHCFFVAPDHVLEINVNLNPIDAPADYGRGEVYSDRRETEIAGRPAVTFRSNSNAFFDIYLSPHGDLKAQGNLHVGLRAMGGRGTDHGARHVAVDRKHTEAAVKVMAAAVGKYFA